MNRVADIGETDGGPAWPRWMPWVGVRRRTLDEADCRALAESSGARMAPGSYGEFAFVWGAHDLSLCLLPARAGGEEPC